MFSDNQMAILRILAAEADREFTMSDVGRRIGKAPGVFQRGLNSLEWDGYIASRRQANRRYISYNTSHPLQEEIRTLVRCRSIPLPADVYLGYRAQSGSRPHHLAEPPAVYRTSRRRILILAGPNGAGKTTFAREYLPGEAGCPIFVNADHIAHGLSPFAPDAVAVQAGRLMITELARHIAHRRSVALETTLSGRRYARLIPLWQQQGYAVKLIFLSLPDVELAIARVAGRVQQGGHDIPAETIRRRFREARKNFDTVYRALVDTWALYDNSGNQPVLLDEEES